jgi:hypothetical protein
MNKIKRYATQLGLPPEIVRELRPLGNSIEENEKQLIDALPCYSPDVQYNLVKLAGDGEISTNDSTFITILPGYTRTGQEKLSDLVAADFLVSQVEIKGLLYLSCFPDDVKDNLITQFGLNDEGMRWLSCLSGLPDRDFAEYALRNKLCIQGDGQFTELEKQFLTDRDNYANELVDTYLADLKDAELSKELSRLPDLDSAREIKKEAVEGLEDIVCWVDNFPYAATFEKMEAEGIQEARAYCTPLQMLLALCQYKELNCEELTELTGNYSLNDLIELAWRNPASPYYYGTKKQWGTGWEDYSTVIERVNSPYLVAEFLKDNIPYDIEALIRLEFEDESIKYRDPEAVFRDKKGICADHASLAFEALTVNGYLYETGFEDSQNHSTCRIALSNKYMKVAHAACLVFENGKFYLINTGVLSPSEPGKRLEGPFNTVEELASSAFEDWDCYTLCGATFFSKKRVCR